LWTEPLLPIDADPPGAVDAGKPWALARQPADRWEWSAGDTGPDDGHPLAVDIRGAAPGPLGVAMRFAEHLFALRVERQLVPGAVILAAARPERIPRHVRIPHLTTVIDRTGRTGDRVIWEQLPERKVGDWLGGAPEPDWDWLTGSLGPLMALRARARAGQLDATADHRELARLIGNRFLSIRTVCLHTALFHRLLAA
jgi:hypothetical protein